MNNDNTNTYNAIITEQGNGFPDVGDYVTTGDSLWEIVALGSDIRAGYDGQGDWIRAEVIEADWSDCDEEHSAAVEVTGAR